VTRSRKILFTCLTWLAVLLLAEGGARAFYWLKDDVPPTPDESLENEWKWAKQHLEAGRPTLESRLAHDPHTGWRLRPELEARRAAALSRDRRGQSARGRILLLGDSYTFGHGVPAEETFGAVLAQELLPDWDFVNLAVPGSGTDQQLITFERRGKQIRPDIVVLGFFVRDYSRNVLTFRDFAKPRYVVDGEGLTLVGSPVPPPEALFDEYVSGRRRIGEGVVSYGLNAVRRSILRLWSRSYTESAPGWKVLSRLMTEFREQAVASGAKPVWLVIPYRDVMQGRSKFEPLEVLCERHAAELDMPCLRLDGAFREYTRSRPDDPIYPKSGHISGTGHRVAATAIHAFLIRLGLLETRRPGSDSD
jgi:hypothetical protein